MGYHVAIVNYVKAQQWQMVVQLFGRMETVRTWCGVLPAINVAISACEISTLLKPVETTIVGYNVAIANYVKARHGRWFY